MYIALCQTFRISERQKRENEQMKKAFTLNAVLLYTLTRRIIKHSPSPPLPPSSAVAAVLLRVEEEQFAHGSSGAHNRWHCRFTR